MKRRLKKTLLWTCSVVSILAVGIGGVAYSLQENTNSDLPETQMYLVDELNEINGIDNFVNFDFSLLKDNIAFEPSHKYTSYVDPKHPDDPTQMYDYYNAITADFFSHINDGLPNFIKTSFLCYFMCIYMGYAFSAEIDQTYKLLNDKYVKDFCWKVLDFSTIKYTKHTSRESYDQFSFSGKFELYFKAAPFGTRTDEETIDVKIEVYDVPFSFINLFTLGFVFLGTGCSYDFETEICHTVTYVNGSLQQKNEMSDFYLYSFPGTPWNDIFSDIDLLLME